MNPTADATARRPIIISALSPDQHWESGLAGIKAYRGLQSLFGWDAQLRSFGALVKRLGFGCWFTPAPEMFFAQAVTRLLAPGLGLEPDDLTRAIHLRFSGARFARVLRGVPNLLVNAEGPWNEILAPGKHPFRAHNVAPHAMQGSLDLAAAVAPVFRHNGTAIPQIAVPQTAIAADLPPWNESAVRHGPIDPAEFRGVEIYSISEFNADDWSGGKLARPSLSIRRIAMEVNASALKGAADAAARPLLLLPWNLANPANCAVDLAIAYLRAVRGSDLAGYVVLLPFNQTSPIGAQLGPLIALIRQRVAAIAPSALEFAADPAPASLFVGRITDLAGVHVLRRLRGVAWVDGLDPEAAWTRARLAAIGIASLGVTRSGGGEAAVLDETAMIEVHNEFGRLFYRHETASLRGVERLIGMTRELRAVVLPALADDGAEGRLVQLIEGATAERKGSLLF